jgi:hypothetical protein
LFGKPALLDASTVASSGQKLHIIVTCTERKTAKVPEHLHLRNVDGDRPDVLASRWIERLAAEVTTPAVRVSNLYAGEHWTRAKALPDLVVGAETQLWACSAGYGLISAQAPVRPYAATLSPGHPDSVPGGGAGVAAWWEALSNWEGPEPGQPRTFREFAKSDPDATFLLVMSATYLEACRTDIEAAAAATDQDRFMIVSAGTRVSTPLDRQLLPANARLQAHLGGTRQVLNVRIAENLLQRQLLSCAAATEYLEELLKSHPDMERWDRKKFSGDADVIDWICEEYQHGRGASASRMLRGLRDSGRACEQKRFGRLHKQFLDEQHSERTGSQP